MRFGSSIRRRRGGGRRSRGRGRAREEEKAPEEGRFRRLGIRFLDLFRPFPVGPVLGSLGLLALVGFGGGYVISTRLLFPLPPPPGDVTPVPDLSGAPVPVASEALREQGLFLGEVDSLRHPTAEAGMILGQSPLPGQQSLVGDTVRVTVSMGPERRPVPDVTRLRADRAQVVLEASGFAVVMDSVESDIPTGGVVEMVPEAGTEAVIPLQVHLTVSRGPPQVEVPLLLGLPEEQALSILESLGLQVGEVETRFRFGRDQGLVVEQEPPAGTLVEKGSAVRLVVGRRGSSSRNNRQEAP